MSYVLHVGVSKPFPQLTQFYCNELEPMVSVELCLTFPIIRTVPSSEYFFHSASKTHPLVKYL